MSCSRWLPSSALLKIVLQAATGETVAYRYDALKRLSHAQGSNWSEQYSYDGWGT